MHDRIEFNPAISRLPAVGNGGAVPYIAQWAGEHLEPTPVIERVGIGIGYADETALDRDKHGALWQRNPSLPGPLRRSYVAVRANSRISGISGALYQGGRSHPVPVAKVTVSYGNPAVRWTLATQLVRTLHDCTIVDLDAE
jgi:hypothetical protein